MKKNTYILIILSLAFLLTLTIYLGISFFQENNKEFTLPSPLENIYQTITNLTVGNVYPITVKYMYPRGSGFYAARFRKPSVNSAYVKIGGDTTFLPGGSGVSENTWYSTTINYTATSTSVYFELGMDGRCVDAAATAFDFGPTAVLPVDLIHFDVNAVANHLTDLHWSTASEINNSHFEIERSYDGRNFARIRLDIHCWYID